MTTQVHEGTPLRVSPPAVWSSPGAVAYRTARPVAGQKSGSQVPCLEGEHGHGRKEAVLGTWSGPLAER